MGFSAFRTNEWCACSTYFLYDVCRSRAPSPLRCCDHVVSGDNNDVCHDSSQLEKPQVKVGPGVRHERWNGSIQMSVVPHCEEADFGKGEQSDLEGASGASSG